MAQGRDVYLRPSQETISIDLSNQITMTPKRLNQIGFIAAIAFGAFVLNNPVTQKYALGGVLGGGLYAAMDKHWSQGLFQVFSGMSDLMLTASSNSTKMLVPPITQSAQIEDVRERPPFLCQWPQEHQERGGRGDSRPSTKRVASTTAGYLTSLYTISS